MPSNREDKKSAASRRSMTGKPSTNADDKMTDIASEPNKFTPQRAHAGITRDVTETPASSGRGGIVRRLASQVRSLFSRNRNRSGASATDTEMPLPQAQADAPRAARVARRETDIPMDRLDNAYIPTQTSLKGGFRDDGSDRHRSQEFASGVADDRWNDEDHYTNKSEDPRIGTRGRTYEPGEARNDSRE